MNGPRTAELVRALHRLSRTDLTQARHLAEELYDHLTRTEHAQTAQGPSEALHHLMHLLGGLPLPVRSALIRHMN